MKNNDRLFFFVLFSSRQKSSSQLNFPLKLFFNSHHPRGEAHLVLFGRGKKSSEQEFRRPHQKYLTSINAEIDRRDDGDVRIARRISDI